MNAPLATFDCRQAFAETLSALARENDRIVAVCNDSVGSSNLVAFQKELPNRLVNVGIAEQDLIGVAAGLANGGFIPFVCAAAPFLTGRAAEQIKADVAYSRYHIVLCGMSPGMAYGELGPTHHSIEDLSWMRAMSGLSVLVPADPEQTIAAVKWAAAADKPIYMRIGRTKVPSVSAGQADPFVYGKANVVRGGGDVTVIATGILVSRAIEASERLAAEGIGVRVVNMSTISPLDEAAVIAAAKETGAIVTAEEAMTEGGLGAAVASVVVRHHPVPMRILGVTGFAPTGSAEFLLDHFHLNAGGIIAAVRELRG
ncbi:Transketolase central region [uncultured Pleomorphomonas sp.]|uniref:Transketolase central region n=1 Tax=uncultured Pleomorphomonas sp. TaxID=442121 RepID=A0A212LFB3_9HYPH|nr:transketolase C-terminal domain-containing protein [uncultured Pleomorphomonas sp.]SCM76069.1 Transketolase central region [uncultured Pleomorphomonas sp.]